MKFTLTIQCDNAAFEDAGLGIELGDILHRVRMQVVRFIPEDAPDDRAILDTNGNRVGQWKLTGRRVK